MPRSVFARRYAEGPAVGVGVPACQQRASGLTGDDLSVGERELDLFQAVAVPEDVDGVNQVQRVIASASDAMDSPRWAAGKPML
jgi:hypothetical protein